MEKQRVECCARLSAKTNYRAMVQTSNCLLDDVVIISFMTELGFSHEEPITNVTII